MRFTIDEVVAVTGGRLLNAVPDAGVIDYATQDSREAGPGALFVPLVDKRDGHGFIADAVRCGASAFLFARGRKHARGRRLSSQGAAPISAPPAAAIEVDAPMPALTALADEARRRLASVPVVGITGSVGKTTAKDLTAAVLGLKRRTHASTRSYNNEIGVPLTLLAAPDDAEAVVLELASRGPGHIRALCDTARPTMGVVTAVGLVHTSEFGSLEAVVSAKRELVESLPAAAEGGVAFLNADMDAVAGMADHTPARVVFFGAQADAHVTARDVTLDADLRPRFTLVSRLGAASAPGEVGVSPEKTGEVGEMGAAPGGTGEVEVLLGARGRHSVGNALAAASVGLALGVSLEDVAAGLAAPALSPLRMELIRTPRGARVINDSYNASPLSARAALRSLAALPCDRRFAVLGVMAELGDYAPAEHAAVASLAEALGIQVIAVDAPLYAAAQHSGPDGPLRPRAVVEAADLDEAAAALARLGALDADSAVLVKGSRVAGLERLAHRLASEGG